MTNRVVQTHSTFSLLDLFVTSADASPMDRFEATVKLPAGLASTSKACCEQFGWLPDTVFHAAWLFVQHVWLGLDEIELSESISLNSAKANWVTRQHQVSPDLPVRQWLNAVNLARKAQLSTEMPVQTGTMVLGKSLWVAQNSPTPISIPSGASLVLGIRQNIESEMFFDFPRAALETSQARTVLNAIVCTAESLLRTLEGKVSAVYTLGKDQLRQLLAEWNPAPSTYTPSTTVHGLFTQQAKKSVDATALVCKGERVSYQELDRRSSLMASRIQAMGVVPGNVVCIALGRSIESVVVLLGILKTGAVYLPADTNYPAERLQFMLEDARAILAVTSSEHLSAFPQSVPVLLVDDARLDASKAARGFQDPTVGSSLAYIMYTSGSTGTPKGIEICHHSIIRLVVNAKYISLAANEKVLHAAPLGFDASTLEIWGPLLNGGCCVLHDEDLPTPSGLGRTISNEGVTTAWLTAALFNAVVDDDPVHLNGLSQLLVGGEALSVPHVRKALKALPKTTLINGYGPTECTTFTATYRIPHDLPATARSVPIGRPITDTSAYVLSPSMQHVPIGIVGELYVGGRGLARGYLNQPDLTAERFVPDPFGVKGERLYRTGDLVRYRADGNIEFIGRADGQVKVRGFRIELGEIESTLATHTALKSCAVIADKDIAGNHRLVAYLVANDKQIPIGDLRNHLSRSLPEFMVPTAYVWVNSLPITSNGKLDRRALPPPSTERPEQSVPYQSPIGSLEQRVCGAFAEALGLDRVGRIDNFFDLGGNSLLVLKVLMRLERDGATGLSTNTFFRKPTPEALAAAMGSDAVDESVDEKRLVHRPGSKLSLEQEPIAVIAMAGRFPGARDIEQFWDNLCVGKDTITFFKDGELDPSIPVSLTSDPCYVKARGVIDDVDMFDASFFGISPREAELMDPQQRIFLELCWECLERGGHAPDVSSGPVGIFAGMYNATYFQRHLMYRPDLIEKLGDFQVMLGNEKDYIATRVANRLNLTGPAVSVHTACSTSLVAIAQAFTSLRMGQCDMALAGGSSVTCPPRSGYLFQDGAMLSPDGQTRSFDSEANGTVFSDGASVVLLKRLSDALADGNTIHAVIRGVAVNNDGRDKASFTAPSIDGQAAVVAAAHEAAGINPRSLSYVETHGTATPMGDPVEVEALTRAFRRHTKDIGFCRIGSVKSNVGHMVIAAGAAGVIKTAMSLATEKLPPSIHYKKPNPKIEFANSPFVVNDRLTPWPRSEQPRRAGVSSFGVGGTNAHVVLEEAPLEEPSSPAEGLQILKLSAKTRTALDVMSSQLAEYLKANPTANLADVAHTLQVGRSRFAHRMSVVADTPARAVQALITSDDPQRAVRALGASAPSLVWMFPGQGSQYAGMGSGLYALDPYFRAAFDECTLALSSVLPFDLKARMFQGGAGALAATDTTQPATFCLEYALAQSWLARGARPVALIGHSVGEFVAAVVSGVMKLADAARLVAKRGAIMQALPRGSMLSVRLSSERLLTLLPPTLSLAAENGPNACVVAGPTNDIEDFCTQLEAQGFVARMLQTSHAFHSAMMDAAVDPFETEVRKVALSAPTIPIVSTLTGEWLSAEEATNPRYWARHLREPVYFSPALRTAQAQYDAAFLEIGPRGTLSTLARQHVIDGKTAPVAVASLGDTPESEATQLTLAQGQLWALGFEMPLSPMSSSPGRKRIRLPTYPFERKRFWVDAGIGTLASSKTTSVSQATPIARELDATTMTPNWISSPAEPNMPISNTLPISAPSSSNVSRRPQLVTRLKELFEDVAGIDLGSSDAAASFVELGLDSLTLTQAALQVKKKFSVSITFRQLMEKYRSFNTLAEFLDTSMAPEPTAVSTEPASPIVANLAQAIADPMNLALTGQTVSADSDLMRQVISQQMQLMAQQLAMLRGDQPASSNQTGSKNTAVQVAQVTAPAAGSQVVAPLGEGERVTYDVKKAFGAIARIHTQPQDLTERQRARLNAFTRRYVERTQKSKAYTVQHRNHLADPRVVNGFRPMTKEITYQIVVERSKGSRMWDLDGNEYVDTLNGFGMNLFGWQADFINEAVHKQVDMGYEIGPQHPLAGEVADLICELTGFDRAAMCNTGSEAVMAAVRIARTVTGRDTLIIFAGSYHGTFDEVLVRAGRGGKGIPAAPGIMSGVFGDVRVLDYGTPESLEFIRKHADDIAAVLVEPVQSRRPDFQPREFLKEVRGITENSGACLIFDEVITGFRSHLGGIQSLFGIRADLACYGKVIGGGFPVGVVAGKRSYMDALDGGDWQYGDDSIPTVGVTYFAGTFVRHPLALAAAKASLEHLKEQGPELQNRLNNSTAALAKELTLFCQEVGAPIEIKHFSSLWRVSWKEEHPLQDLLFAMMRSRGIHILDNFPCFLTTAHSESDIQLIASAFKDSVRELQESDFLPSRSVSPVAKFDASVPPVDGARLGKDSEGKPAWFIRNPSDATKYMMVNT